MQTATVQGGVTDILIKGRLCFSIGIF